MSHGCTQLWCESTLNSSCSNEQHGCRELCEVRTMVLLLMHQYRYLRPSDTLPIGVPAADVKPLALPEGWREKYAGKTITATR